jgi:hypothetical protein
MLETPFSNPFMGFLTPLFFAVLALLRWPYGWLSEKI